VSTKEIQPELASQGEGIKPLYVGLATFFLPPLGLILLWRHPTLSRNKTWWWVGGVWCAFFVLAAMNGDKDKKPSADAPATAQASADSPAPAKETPSKTEDKESKEKKSYKVSKGWGRGSIVVELPKDYDLGIEFADFELSNAGILSYTLTWHAFEGGNPRNMRWSSYDSKGVKLNGMHLDFGDTIQSGEPTKGDFVLGYDEWKKTDKIKVE